MGPCGREAVSHRIVDILEVTVTSAVRSPKKNRRRHREGQLHQKRDANTRPLSNFISFSVLTHVVLIKTSMQKENCFH